MSFENFKENETRIKEINKFREEFCDKCDDLVLEEICATINLMLVKERREAKDEYHDFFNDQRNYFQEVIERILKEYNYARAMHLKKEMGLEECDDAEYKPFEKDCKGLLLEIMCRHNIERYRDLIKKIEDICDSREK